jgi:hypothetical protein
LIFEVRFGFWKKGLDAALKVLFEALIFVYSSQASAS